MAFKDSNINIQMNYWSAETTNLDVTASLFDYFEVCVVNYILESTQT